jgi:hypothetical protein
VRLTLSNESSEARANKLFYARQKLLASLLIDDPSAAEIQDLAAAIRPYWHGDPAMLAILEDPRWQTKIQARFEHACRIFQLFSNLGPRHAGMARRYGRTMLAAVALHTTAFWEAVGEDTSSEEWRASFLTGMEEQLDKRARWVGVTNASVLGSRKNRQWREVEETIAEGVGLDYTTYRAQVGVLRKDIRTLTRLVWREAGMTRKMPGIHLLDRWKNNPENDLGLFGGLYSADSDSYTIYLPSVNWAAQRPHHGLPEQIPDDLSPYEISAWEPCLDADTRDYNQANVVIHETTHAIGRRMNQRFDPSAPYFGALEAFCRKYNHPTPETCDWTGLTMGIGVRGGDQEDYPCRGLHIYDEMLTEAAARELYDRLDDRIPESLRPIRHDRWNDVAIEHSYRRGKDVVAAFLPDGHSALDVIASPDPVSLLVAGIKGRISAEAASQVCGILFDNELFFADPMPELMEGRSEYSALAERLRVIVIEDDDANRLPEPIADDETRKF